MDIKTTHEIRNSLTPPVTEQIAKLYWVKKWVAVDEMKRELREFGKLIGNNEPLQLALDRIYIKLTQKQSRK